MATITSANSIFMLGVASVFPIPQKVQGFATDDAFTMDPIDPAEMKMGVDGKLSAGFVFTPFKMMIVLQADSDSVLMFDAWYAAQKAQVDVFAAFGVLRYPSIRKSFALTTGYLGTYQPVADAKKTLDPMKYSITWESVIGAPI